MTEETNTPAEATTRFYIVWNGGRSEGFITSDYDDAHQASTGKFHAIRSTLGQAFFECYGEDEDADLPLEIEHVDLPANDEDDDAADGPSISITVPL